MNINESDLVKLEIDENRIGTITFNNPKSLNALNSLVLEAFNNVLIELKERKDVLGVIVTGEGEKAFIAGADIKEMLSMSNEEARSFSELGQQVTLLMESISCPVIACVNGFALGGGLEMALGADFIYCSKNAIFGLPEVKLGLIPGFGGTQRLSRVVGRNVARELIFSGKSISSSEAYRINLVNEVYENKDELISGAKKFLVSVQENSLFSIGKAKDCLLRGIEIDLIDGLQLEGQIFSGLFDSEDAKEGTKAFAEKRKAIFQHTREKN